MASYPLVIVVALGGCRIGFDELERIESCAWDPPVFATEERIDAIAETGVNIGDPTLSADGLTLFYHREGTVLAARRASRTSPFGAGVPVPELAPMAGQASGFFVDADGLTAFVSLEGTGDADLFQLTRSTTDEPFGVPTKIAELASPGYEFNLRVLADGLTAVFVRWLDNADPMTADSYVAQRPTRDAPWTNLAPTPFSTPGVVDAAAHPVPGGFVFDTDGGLSVTHGSFATGFDTPTRLAIDSGGYDGLPFVSSDGCELFFVSDRDGSFHIYRAAMLAP